MHGPASAVRASAALFAGLVIACGAGAQSADEPALSGYTCCNFHYEGDWISDANWSMLPMIPAGSPIRTLEYWNNRIVVEIVGRKMRLGLDYGRRQTLADWARKMIVQEDPKPKIAAWPALVRDAIREGKIAIGMTKEQVIVSVGYPPAHETPSMDAPRWKYWHTGFGTYLVVWDDSGRVKDVLADPQVRAAVLPLDSSKPPAQQGTASVLTTPGLPAAGTSWTYHVDDRAYRRNSTSLSVQVLRVDDQIVEEQLSISAGATRTPVMRRAIDAPRMGFLQYPIGANTVLVEFAPYLLTARGGKAWNNVLDAVDAAEYPIGGTGLPRWVARSHTPSWEQVTVPAGTFRALRLEVDGRRERIVFAHGQAGRFRIIVWYAPEVKRFVKLEHEMWSSSSTSQSGNRIGHDVVELLSYRPPS